MAGTYQLRSATPEDEAFLRELFAQMRPEFSLLPTEIAAPLLEMQYRARRLGYAEHFPNLETFVITGELDSPVGTLLLAEVGDTLRIVDLAVMPAHQGHGAGSFAIKSTFEHSKEVRLRVKRDSLAEGLYLRLGFQRLSEEGMDIEMSNKSGCPENGATLGIPKSRLKLSGMNTLTQKVCGGGIALLALIISPCFGQGILTVSPGAIANSVAGTGTLGYTGDGSSATAATIAQPGAIAYDKVGNLYIADSNNHVIREITPSGTITTIAGNGIEGFSGDNSSATAAQLDTPTGIAVDAGGNIYIADSHNQRIRKISAGTITTIAGTGTAGFSGDGAQAVSAQLALPSAVALDISGNLYIADTNNHRIRAISGGTISTVAGDGEELFAGDGGLATSAALDSPTGVAVSSAGTIYIADRLNHRIRAFTVGGAISTVAGSGNASFSGSFGGDGASASAASLARPTGVSVDASGNVYVADTDNQRVRKFVNGGAIVTIVGTGEQGFAADGGLATSAVLNTPKSVTPDAAGNLAMADTLNQRVRNAALSTLTFGNDGVGILSAAQPVTLTNSGTGTLAVGSVSFTGPFTAASGGTCSATPISLGPGASCTQNVAYLPIGVGSNSGSVVFGGGSSVPQSVLLAGTAVPASTTTKLTTNIPTALTGQAVIFTATLQPVGLGSATGSMTFFDNGAPIATVNVVNNSASLAIATLPTGTDVISASYGGDSNFIASKSGTVSQLVEDFSLTVSGVSVLSIVPGSSATFSGALQSLQGSFGFPIALSVSGLPPGAVATFNPSSITLGSTGQATTTLTVQTASTARLHYPLPLNDGTATLALLLLPMTLSRRLRRRIAGVKYALPLLMLTMLGSLIALTGCGPGSGLLGQQQQSYSINLIGTATGANGATLTHTTVVTLTVQ
jgi:sugar lactone lactonase YvrE/GNAT superfamily N-acetyltransferase